MDCSMPGFPECCSLPGLAQTHVHLIGDPIQPSRAMSSSSPAFSLFSIRVFSNEVALCIRWPIYWSFNFSISPSNKYSGLISFRIDCLISLQSKELSGVFSSTQFEGIDTLVLSLLYGQTLTSIHEYWKNHSFDYTDLCRQSNVSAF